MTPIIGTLAALTGFFAVMAFFRWREAGRERVIGLLAGRRTAQVRGRIRGDGVAARIPVVRRLQVTASQAGVALTGEQILAASVLAAAAGYGLLLILTASSAFSTAGLAAGVLAPTIWLRILRSKRAPLIGAQLPSSLRLWAQGIRGGRSVQDALAASARDTPVPLGPEMALGVRAMGAGAAPDEAMAAIAERLGHPDMALVVGAVRLHQKLGGSLAEPLLSVAQTAQERMALRQSVAAKTAQVRLGAYVVLALPPGMMLVFQIFNHAYIASLVGTSQGIRMLIIAAGLMAIAVVWIRGVLRTAAID